MPSIFDNSYQNPSNRCFIFIPVSSILQLRKTTEIPVLIQGYLFKDLFIYGMEWQKLGVAIAILALILSMGTVVAYTTAGDSNANPGGGISDGNTGGGGDTGGDGGGDTGSDGNPGSCYDDADNDLFNQEDEQDGYSCVKPFGSDHIEGSIWDADLTTVMDGESPSLSETESVFFSGTVYQGNDATPKGTPDSGSLTEYYIQDDRSEVSGFFGFGKLNSVTYSNIPGDVQSDGRVIDSPNDLGTGSCGDGIENDGEKGFSQVMSEVRSDHGGETINCRADYGRILEEEHVKSEYLISGLTCRPDDGCQTSTSEGSRCSPCSANVYGCNDYSADDGNDYWEKDGSQRMTETTCRDNGDYIEYVSESCSDSWSTGPSPEDRDSCNDFDDDTGGNDRQWYDNTDNVNCNTYNAVDGGGDDGGKESSDFSNEYPNKADNDPAATFTDFKVYANDNRGSDGEIWCQAESTLTVDADGPRGNGDGFVVVHEGEIVATESPNGDPEVGTAYYGRDGSYGNTRSFLSEVTPSCFSTDKDTCLKYADFQTKDNDGGDNSWSISEAVRLDTTTTVYPDDSYSICKNINRINRENGDGTELIDCDYERGSPGSEDVSPLPEAGGDEPNEHLIMMEGPAVDNSVTKDYLAFEQRVVDWEEDTGVFGDSLDSNACVTKGKVVSEGTVVPIQTFNVVSDSFETGTPSTDWEVCLDLDDGTGDDRPWDNDANNQESQDFGGEWYDLDDERVNDYLMGAGSNLISSRSSDINDISFYWRENPNPRHSQHNPTGGDKALVLEDDCDPALSGCDTTGTSIQGESGGLFYGSFEDFTRDEDYHPQFQNADTPYGMNHLLLGNMKKIKEDSNQLEPGMDTDYSMDFSNSDNYWFDSRGGEDYADQYGYVDKRSDAISNRGKSRNPSTGEDYVPGSTYARTSSAIRGGIEADSVTKEQKVFGNSIVVNSTSSGPFTAGEGYWLDPDDLEAKNSDFDSDWWSLVRFNIDLSGPDSGLGWDNGNDPEIRNYDFKQGSSVIRGGIHWEDEATGGTDYHEQPMCGDDQLEFLIEEMGESATPDSINGRYACTASKDNCVTFASEPHVAEIEEYRNTEEPDENVGRLKQDQEICLKDVANEQSKWWDQDYGDVDGDGTQDTCDVNNLYSAEGVRWIDSNYVTTHPNAVTGGIDDDWNEYIQTEYDSGRTDRHVSLPDQNSWNFGSESPVPSGSRAVGNDSIATLGFCGGDDDGEFLVTQECNSNLCTTNRSVLGVAKNPDSCVIDEDTLRYDTSVDERTVFEPGAEIDVNLGSQTRTMTCFNNNWFDKYPVVFNRDKVNVPFGDSSTVSFHLINVRQEATTFEVELLNPFTDDPSAFQYTQFVEESGDSFETTVPAESSQTYNLRIQGSNKAIGDSSSPSDDELTVRATAINSDMRGEDSTTVEVVQNNATNSSIGRTEPQSVPGIGAVQIMAIILLSTAVFFLQN